MISIDRLKSLKSEVSSLFVLKRCGHAKLESKILSEDLLDFVNKEAEENDRTFFAFNKLTHWEIVAIIDECETEYKQVEKLRKLGGKLLDFCDNEYIKHLQFISSLPKHEALGFVEGMLLASYTFDSYKTDPKKLIHPFDQLSVINQEVEMQDIERLLIIVGAVEKCKDLVNEPYCSLNAEGLAAAFVNMSHEAGIDVEVWHKDKIEKEKMGGLLAVNKGSMDPPTFTIMRYSPNNAVNSQPIVLVGKGLVYDTGGLNLKPGDYMNDMKEDMAGAAMMASALYAVA